MTHARAHIKFHSTSFANGLFQRLQSLFKIRNVKQNAKQFQNFNKRLIKITIITYKPENCSH